MYSTVSSLSTKGGVPNFACRFCECDGGLFHRAVRIVPAGVSQYLPETVLLVGGEGVVVPVPLTQVKGEKMVLQSSMLTGGLAKVSSRRPCWRS